MWTHSNTATSSSNNWAPNHFVPLVPKEDASNCNSIYIDDINAFPPLSPNGVHSPMQSSTPIKQSFQTDNTSSQTCDPVSVHSESNNSDQQLINSDSDCNVEVTNLSLQVDQPYKNPTINSLNGAFMSVDKLFKVATTPTPTGDCIPQGVNENAYFVINDTENRIRRQNKKYSEYPDDCGARQKGKNSTKSHDFILTGDSLTFVVKKGVEYCKKVKKVFHFP
jgi:hypothetical protein